jgi:hypothetical protein
MISKMRSPLQWWRDWRNGRLLPEATFVVSFDEVEVRCVRPDGKVESVRWDDLQSVWIATTDDGPFGTDVYWVLEGAAGGCAIPQGAIGERELLKRLQRLPGFDSAAVVAAMGSTSNQRFDCWKHP